MKQALRNYIIFGSSLAVGICAYAAYKYWKKRQFKSIDEGFEDVSRIEENPVRKILVLGLKDAGKTTLLKQMTDSVKNSKMVNPTEGFYLSTLEQNGITLNLWEVGGGDKYKPYWSSFFEGVDLLVFVVDSADLHNLSLAVIDVARVLADPILTKVPVVIVAHKQDLPEAMSPAEVARALDVNHAHHPVTILGTCAPPTAQAKHPTVEKLEQTLLHLALG